MAVTIDKLGATYSTTSTAVQLASFTIPSWLTDLGAFYSQGHAVQISVITGTVAYEIVAKGADAPAMTTATVFDPTTVIFPKVIHFNPTSQDLYVKCANPTTFSVSE